MKSTRSERRTRSSDVFPDPHGFELKIILQHYNLLNASPDSLQVALADQVLVDVGGGRGRQRISLEGKHLDLIQRVLAVTDAPLGLAGRLSAEAVRSLAPSLSTLRALTDRPLAFDAESQLRTCGNLDLNRVQAFTEACWAALEAPLPAPRPPEAE